MNFPYLAGFKALQFVGRPVPKTIDIFFDSFQNFFLKTQHSAYYVVHEERAHDKASCRIVIPSFHSLRLPWPPFWQPNGLLFLTRTFLRVPEKSRLQSFDWLEGYGYLNYEAGIKAPLTTDISLIGFNLIQPNPWESDLGWVLVWLGLIQWNFFFRRVVKYNSWQS